MIVYDEFRKPVSHLSFLPYETVESLPNSFINALSEAQGKMRSFWFIELQLQIHSQMIKQLPNRYRINIQFDSLTIVGNFDYKGFDFTQLILPNQWALQYEIYEQNTQTSQSKKITLDPTHFIAFRFDSTLIDSSDKASLTIRNEKLVYKYSSQQKTDFEQAIGLINTYYDEGKLMQAIQTEISLLDTASIDKILLESIDLKYIKKTFDKLKLPNYADDLNLSSKDPANFFTHYQLLSSNIEQLNNFYQSRVKLLDTLFYQKGMQLLQNKNASLAKEYFQKSLNFDSTFINSHYQLAKLDFEQSDYLKAAGHINKALDQSINHREINQLANELYEAMLQQGIKWNNEENFTASLDFLQKAAAFCARNQNVITCNPIESKAINEAKYGLYESYLKITRASLRQSKLSMAQSYLNTAYDYQIKYPEAIASTHIADALQNLLITEYLRISIELFQRNKVQKSKTYLHLADSIANIRQLYDGQKFVANAKRQIEVKKEEIKPSSTTQMTEQSIEIKPTEKIMSSLDSAHCAYRQFYKNGVEYHQSKNDVQAFIQFQQADSLQKQFHFGSPDSLHQLMSLSAPSYLLQYLQSGSLQVWAMRFDLAENILNQAKNIINVLNLNDNTELSKALIQLENELKKEIYKRVSRSFEQNMNKAQQSFLFTDYLSGLEYCRAAIALSDSFPSMGFNVDFPKSLLIKYKQPIAYQLLITKAKTACMQAEYDSAILYYDSVQWMFSQLKANIPNLNQFTLLALIQHCNQSGIYDKALEYSFSNNLSEYVFPILQLAESKELTISSSLMIQSMEMLAKLDKAQYPQGNKVDLFDFRFGKSNYYKKYRKYYYSIF